MSKFLYYFFVDVPTDFIVCFGGMLAVMVILIGCSPRKKKS